MLESWKISQDVAPRTVWRLQGPSPGFMWSLSSPEKGFDWGRPTVFLLFWLLISLNSMDTDPLCHPKVNKEHLGGVGMVLCQVRILWSETLVSDQRLRQGCSCSNLGVKPDMGVGATSVKSSPCWDSWMCLPAFGVAPAQSYGGGRCVGLWILMPWLLFLGKTVWALWSRSMAADRENPLYFHKVLL